MWLAALFLALAFLAVDTNTRLQTLRTIYPLRLGEVPAPRPDAASPTGYERGQHRLLLPGLGADGYHWIMHTERMLAGDGLRIRTSTADGPPEGRAVHWSGSVRWWLAAVATAYRWRHPELSPGQAVERVAPWANTLALAVLMIGLTAALAVRLGAAAAALFAIGNVAVYPLYQYSAAGFIDHHNFVALAAFAAVAFLAAGGAGWVRRSADPAPRGAHGEEPPAWLPAEAQARRWFVAAGIAGGAAMWISAVTMVPVLIGTGVGALLAIGLLARTPARDARSRLAPRLWRVWGMSGAATCVAFYVLEYFPGVGGFRLEVNHPLYALAWLAAGDLLARFGDVAVARHHAASDPADPTAAAPPATSRWHWMVLDLVAIGAVPAIIMLGRGAVFTAADPFLWALHEDYILEFQSLTSQLAALNHWQLFQGVINLLPLLALPLAAVLWPTELARPWKTVWRGFLLGACFVTIAFLHAACFAALWSFLGQRDLLPSAGGPARALVHAMCLVVDAGAVAVFFLLPRCRAPLPAPTRAVLALALAPAVLLLVASFRQIRWLGLDAALWLAVVVVAAGVVRGSVDWSRARRLVAALCLGLAFLPSPLFTALFPWRLGYPAAPEATQLLTRDIAHLLRARLGDEPGTVVSGPTTSTWLAWFGGVRALGTLYWENVAGLRAAAAIYGAPSPEQARHLIDRYRVTHIVVCSFDAFTNPYVRLDRGLRLDARMPRAVPDNAFIVRLVGRNETPPWLVRIPFALPALSTLRGQQVWIFEVRRDRKPLEVRN